MEGNNEDGQQGGGAGSGGPVGGGGGGGQGGHGRKRNNDNSGDYGTPNKKSFMNDPDAVYLKFMVPQATAGSVIGKGGSNISDLQKEFNVHIRMSKANDVFPGTDSRVALMSGNVADVLNATMVIFKRMTSPSDLFPKNPRPKSVSDKEISLIVPQSTAGLIIGKGGTRVKSIQEESNCHINLTQKTEKLSSNERVVTIQNNDVSVTDNIEKALKAILEVIKTDPSSSSCLMINYTNPDGDRPRGGYGDHHNSRRGGGDDYNDDYYEEPRGRGWDRGNRGGNMGPMDGGMGMRGGRGGGIGGDAGPIGGGGIGQNASGFSASGYPPQVHFWCTFSGPPISNGHTPPPHMIEGMKGYLLNVGYPPKAIQEIIAASNILASYGVLKPGNISIFNTPQMQQAANPFNTMGTGNGASGDGLGLAGLGNLGGTGGGLNNLGSAAGDGGWSNNAGGGMNAGAGGSMFMKQFGQQGGVGGGGVNRSYDGGFDSSYGMGGINSGNDVKCNNLPMPRPPPVGVSAAPNGTNHPFPLSTWNARNNSQFFPDFEKSSFESENSRPWLIQNSSDLNTALNSQKSKFLNVIFGNGL